MVGLKFTKSFSVVVWNRSVCVDNDKFDHLMGDDGM